MLVNMLHQSVIAIIPISLVIVIRINIVNSAVANRLGDDISDDIFSEDTEGSLTLKSADSSLDYAIDHRIHTVPVRHFARHFLCRHQMGKQYFYRAMKLKLCRVKEMFVATFVEDLCKQRGSLLDTWVSELFDIDGDGKITHFEKKLYDTNT